MFSKVQIALTAVKQNPEQDPSRATESLDEQEHL